MLRRRSTLALTLAALAALALAAAPARAQRTLGIGEDALVLPRGVVRASVGGSYESFDERYASSAAGAAVDSTVPLGAALSAMQLGAAQVGGLGALQERLRGLTGMDALTLSLGRSTVRASANQVVVPMRVDVGLGWRLQLSAMVPYVRSRVATDLRVNPEGAGGNLGLNPVLTDASVALENEAIVQALQEGAAELQAAIAACPGGAASPVCSDIAGATAASNAAALAAQQLAAIYGTGEASGAPVVPVAGSAAALAVAQRLGALRSTLLSYEVTAPGEGELPVNATGPLVASELQAVLGDPAFGLAYQPLADVTRYGIGDVELGGRFQLLDTFRGDPARATEPRGVNVRAAVGGLVRLGTGTPDAANHAFDFGVGDGQTDVEAQAAVDVLLGSRFWTSVVARYGVQLADELPLRVPESAEQLFVPAEHLRTLERDLGDYLALEVTPRYTLGEFFMLGLHYSYRRKAEDRYALASADPSSAPVAVRVLELGTEGYEHRAGFGIALSTVRGWARDRVRVPIDVSYLHTRTIAGGGMQTPQAVRDQVMVRVYLRPF